MKASHFGRIGSMMSQARESLLGVSTWRRPSPGSRPIAAAERRDSLSKSAYRRLSRALGGLEARRGLWVKGEIREPKRFQCSGTRRSLFRGQRIGTSDHACQYAFAAWASISLK